MFDILNHFLSEYSFVIDFVVIAFYLVFGLIIFIKTKNINFLSEVFEDMKKFLYRTESQAFDESQNSNGQSFIETKPTYRLNKSSGELEEDGSINVQELINSAVSVALERVLDKFLPKVEEIDNDVAVVNTMHDDLDFFTEAFNKAEDYREQYNLSDSFTVQDIFTFVKNKSNELVKKINDYNDNLQTVENIKSEVISNEKENVKEG